jgi:hypothetical protein
MGRTLGQSQFNSFIKRLAQGWLGVTDHRLVFRRLSGSISTRKIKENEIFTLHAIISCKWKNGLSRLSF